MSKQREQQGWTNLDKTIGTLIVGLVGSATIIATLGTAAPIVACVMAGIVAVPEVYFASSDITENLQEINYGKAGDPFTVATNPIRDTIFSGNPASYNSFMNTTFQLFKA